ncbi:selT/selW/selH selenoprotein domain-containing protein [Colletotrichum karsti]|uniref:SelT/selW/selH selenoprotein domain-containing protein n=1 Tax=Colletotrichum karsti TaxID=1095194 RepID=A0A9P6I1B5_9PEZI|nr:selT/selW/selH selenoprotein domain-containing protein [Colletotrichum karsti]KAF9874010.1 selT/selW/selH selenoprotein domain-containing protein [Colletotrichum karsti]
MAEAAPSQSAPFPLPRVAIQFCTQCKWMLRAAYFAQELLSTFSTSIGEVALQPSTGGTFTVTLTHLPEGATTTTSTILWDRKAEGGFPETKELKRRLRDVIEPNRDLGHVDRKHGKAPTTGTPTQAAAAAAATMSEDKTNDTFADNLPSAAGITSQLKKHPANAQKKDEPSTTEEKSPFDDAARAAIAAAGANKGQQGRAEISPAGQRPGAQEKEAAAAGDKKEVCEDCA